MKVALIYNRLVLRGGLETRLLNYIQYFSKRGDTVDVIVYKSDTNIQLPPNVNVHLLKVRWAPRPMRRMVFNYQLVRFMHNRKYDFSLSLGRTIAQETVLAPSNHLGYLKAIGKTPKTLDDKQQVKYDRLSYLKSKLIYACSQMMKDELMKLYQIDGKKIQVLFPPLNTEKFKKSTETKRELRKIYDIPETAKAYLFVSTGHKRKGIDLLLDLFKLLPSDYQLYIVGYPEVKSNLANVHFLGFAEEPAKLYAAVDFTIHPAKYEPFGQIISESIACGTPVIISNKVGAKEIISQNEGIVLDSFDVSDWRNTLLKYKKEDFNVSIDFVEKHELSLENHMEKMLRYAAKI